MNNEVNVFKEITTYKEENKDRYNAYKEKNNNLSLDEIVKNVNLNLDYNFYEKKFESINKYTDLVLVNKYYYLDEEKTKTVVESLFKTENKDEKSGDNDLTQTSGTLEHENKIRLEVLNAGNNMTTLNNIVEKLNEGEFDVVKIGNYPTIKVETSRIIDYGTGTKEELEDLKKVLKITTVEESTETTNVKYSVIIGANYK